jgi:hypothetical protein
LSASTRRAATRSRGSAGCATGCPPGRRGHYSGCTLVAIEKPFHRGPGIALMMAVYGALLQLLPADLPLLELRSDDWRRECGIPIRKPREAPDNWHKKRAVEFAREQWRDAPPFDHDGAEAFCVAYGAREIDLRAVRAA